jgi:hypothetical protein
MMKKDEVIVYSQSNTGRSVVFQSADSTHEWRYANDPLYRKAYDEWIKGMER